MRPVEMLRATTLLLAFSVMLGCASAPTIGEGIQRSEPSAADPELENVANGDATPPLTVRVVGLRNHAGHVAIAVYNDADAYPEDRSKVIASQKVEIDAGSQEIVTTFDDLPPGRYAIAILHDENKSGGMDTNALGMPKEGYGASRNPGPRLGPPLWKDASFELSGPTELTIEVLY